MTEHLAKLIILAGATLIVIGAAVYLLARRLPQAPSGSFPGDFLYRGRHVTVWVPIGLCITISLLLTAILWILRWLGR